MRETVCSVGSGSACADRDELLVQNTVGGGRNTFSEL